MTKEEYEKLKEAEKAHLRKLRELKQAVRALERQRSVNDALQRMTSATEDALETQSEMVEKLARETALQEARLDIALEEERGRPAADEETAEEIEEAEQRRRAQSLIRQLKMEMGGADDTAPDQEEGARAEKTLGRRDDVSEDEVERGAQTPNPTRPPDERPEKTIGRM